MGKKMLKRDAKRIALRRMEEAARTEHDFKQVIRQWDHLDDNRERRERDHEVIRSDEIMLQYDRVNEKGVGEIRTDIEVVIPNPVRCLWWRLIMRGDFIDMLFCNPDDMWQLVEDKDISILLKGLTEKQKEVIYLRVVRLFTTTNVSKMLDKTDRAVRKLYNATLDGLQDRLAKRIREGLTQDKYPEMTLDKGIFLETYELRQKREKAKKEATPDETGGGE